VSLGWFGPWFGDAGAGHWFGPWFNDGVSLSTLIAGVGPPGVATFALDLESGTKIEFDFQTDITKSYSGREWRTAMLPMPKLRIMGSIILPGPATRQTRASLARYMASGAEFLVALPFEGILLTGAAAGAVVPVTSTSNLDWMIAGTRVVVMDLDGNFNAGVIQSFTSNTVTLDVAPSGTLAGLVLAPAVAFYLDPQQGFARYPSDQGVEAWSIQGVSATFGFQGDARAL
jgi:hypothetical protein